MATPSADITLLQKPSRIAHVMKGGRMVDTTTPIEPRRVWSWEKHKTYLPGKFMYDEASGAGKVV